MLSLNINPVLDFSLIVGENWCHCFIVLTFGLANQSIVYAIKIGLFCLCWLEVANIRIIRVLQCRNDIIFRKVYIFAILIAKQEYREQ